MSWPRRELLLVSHHKSDEIVQDLRVLEPCLHAGAQVRGLLVPRWVALALMASASRSFAPGTFVVLAARLCLGRGNAALLRPFGQSARHKARWSR